MLRVYNLPTTYEVAKWLVTEVTTHIEHYRLRHRCVIKVTTRHVRQLLINRGIINDGFPQRNLASYVGHVLVHFDYLMEQLGFRLVEKRSRKFVTIRYYAIPNCPG